MKKVVHFSWLLLLVTSSFSSCFAREAPWVMRISCGARDNVHTQPTNTVWFKDFGYTGGFPTNANLTSSITPPLKTLRYFPLSEGPNNCYILNRVPKGHYTVRVFFGLIAHPSYADEPLFDISIEGTLIYSLQSGWTTHEDRAFTEALVFLDGKASICFHSTGHGDPAVVSIEILQVDDRAYEFGPGWGHGMILRTAKRWSCGHGKPKFDVDYRGDRWGGDRFWKAMTTFGMGSDQARSTENGIKQASLPPNFYPEALYQTAIVSTDTQPELAYTVVVEPNRNYSIWLHFAEIDPSITEVGQRVFDILINGDFVFKGVDIIKMSGDRYTALVLNTTAVVNGRTLTISLVPDEGSHAIINAIEVFEIVTAESKTLQDEVRAMQALKTALGLPLRLGWNGDPCVPKQHPWNGAACRFDKNSSNWFIDGLGLDSQDLGGYLPDDISGLNRLQSINMSGNNLKGTIPSSVGTIASLTALDLSYNHLNGTIPETLGQLTMLKRLNLNGNSLSGRVPAALGEKLLYGASFNFTDNKGLCGIPGLPSCGLHLSAGAIVGIVFGALIFLLLLVLGSICWRKRMRNIQRAQQMGRRAPYAKARTQMSHDIQMTRHHNHHAQARTAAENGPSLLS